MSEQENHNLPSTESPPYTAIFWDIENVHDEPATHQRMTETIREKGNVVKAFAFADWDSRRQIAESLHSLGYDLIHVPDSRDNAADYKMAAYILEHLVRYPETHQYVMVSGDGDFKLLAGALREKGFDLWIISNPIITASELTGIASTYSDIYSFRPSKLPCSSPEDCEKLMGDVKEMRRIAAIRLQESIIAIEEAGNRPGIGHVKHVMTALNPTFTERILRFRSWNEFLDWAEYEEYVKREGELPATILTIPEKSSQERLEISKKAKEAFKTLCQVVEGQIEQGAEPTLEDLKQPLQGKGIDHSSLGYPTLADFVLAAEKRGFIRVVSVDDETPKIIPDVTVDRVRSWFEENINEYFGEVTKVPKKEFLEKIAALLVGSRTSLKKLESYLHDKHIRKEYESILAASELLFLPPFQMSMAHVFLGQGFNCSQVVEKVNVELEPLGITLKCQS
ncbi:MAG: NYN domain-containing protein [Candidatus Thorarchaeota archaeon]